jgi:hypothetical protein
MITPAFSLKQAVVDRVRSLEHVVIDVGTADDSPVDFPVMTRRVTDLITAHDADRGLLVCGTGVGAAMAATFCRACDSQAEVATRSGTLDRPRVGIIARFPFFESFAVHRSRIPDGESRWAHDSQKATMTSTGTESAVVSKTVSRAMGIPMPYLLAKL